MIHHAQERPSGAPNTQAIGGGDARNPAPLKEHSTYTDAVAMKRAHRVPVSDGGPAAVLRPARRDASARRQAPSSPPPFVGDALRAPGRPLEPSTRASMETQFRRDFTNVRVHPDAAAAKAAGARAYTVGRDIVFAPGEYAPGTGSGQRLLAHELAHVAQQGGVEADPARPVTNLDDAALEADAVRASNGAGSALAGSAVAGAGAVVQRHPDWTDGLAIEFTPLVPTTGGLASYTEGGFLSQRMSNDLPLYQGPFCQNSQLPFRCTVEFFADFTNDPRPQPFRPPQVSVDFRFTPGGLAFTRSDPNPSYGSPGTPLRASFGSAFNFTLSENGPLTMTFTLRDPDSGITRTYADTIQVAAKRPCS